MRTLIYQYFKRFLIFGLIGYWVPGVTLAATAITETLPFVDIEDPGGTLHIQRIRDETDMLDNSFAETSRSCPPFCIHPIKAAPRVETVGELELPQFLTTAVHRGHGLPVDSRTPDWHKKGTIPDAVNLPFTRCTVDPEASVTRQRLAEPGAQRHAAGDQGPDTGGLSARETVLLPRWYADVATPGVDHGRAVS